MGCSKRESGWCSRRTWVVRLDGSGLRRLTCSAYENGDLAAEDWDKLKGEFQEPL